MHLYFIWVIFQKIFQLIIWTKLDYMEMPMIFSVHFDSIAEILDIHKYLIKKAIYRVNQKMLCMFLKVYFLM